MKQDPAGDELKVASNASCAGSDAKLPYESPTLRVHGSAAELIKNTGPFGVDVPTGNTFSLPCDQALKTGIETIDPGRILAELANVAVTRWRYYSDDPEVRHIGPMAQDFANAFGFADTKRIHMVDAIGVALASIQALKSMIEERDGEIDQLRMELRALERRLSN